MGYVVSDITIKVSADNTIILFIQATLLILI